MNEILSQILKRVIAENFSVNLEHLSFETPPKQELGDRAFACFILARDLKKSPAMIAQELQTVLLADVQARQTFQKIEAVGPYLNFFFSADFYALQMQKYFQNPKDFLCGDTSKNAGKYIYIDYIGANVGKPLHIGHMCTPNQGQVFVNLFRKLGYTVISDSHLGDWGIIFGKLISAYKKYGNPEALHTNAVEHLFELYVCISSDAKEDTSCEQDFRTEFKLLSEGNPDSVKLWTEFTKYSIEGMRKSLSRIYVQPDYDIGESFYEGIGLPKMQDYPDLQDNMKDIVQELLKNSIATKNEDNSVGVVFPDELKIPSCILQKRDGTHGYLASDLASIKYRVQNWNPEKIIYFVDVRQQLHLKQAFTIASLAGWIDANNEVFHAYNGFISLKDGAMSTREGRIIKLDALFDEAQIRAQNIILEKRSDISGDELKKLSENIGIGAIKYGYLKKSRENDVIFDWDEFMSFEGNSGPYIQYSYVRAKKILEKHGKISPQKQDFCVTQKEEMQLLSHLLHFSQTLSEMQEGYHAHVLCQYVYEASKLFSSLYANLPILQETDLPRKETRIALLEIYTQVMELSFEEILGIPLAKEM